jgi:hypothetical protein
LIAVKWFGSLKEKGERWRGKKKERRTKAAYGTPATGHEERTLADAPSQGRGNQGTASS